eukprot:2404028-Amphidinium_carterae.1
MTVLIGNSFIIRAFVPPEAPRKDSTTFAPAVRNWNSKPSGLGGGLCCNIASIALPSLFRDRQGGKHPSSFRKRGLHCAHNTRQ